MGAPFGMFDFTPVGAVTALAGVAFIALVGWRLVPVAARKRAVSTELFDIEHYVTEARVTKDSAALGKTMAEIDEATKDIDALLISLLRGERRYRPAAAVPIQAGDLLVIEAGPEEIDKFVTALGLELSRAGRTARRRSAMPRAPSSRRWWRRARAWKARPSVPSA